jgi:hypothetical protein
MKKIELNEQVDRVKVLMGIKDTNVIVENNDLVDDGMIYENQESLDEQLKALLRNFSDDAIKLLGGEIKGLPMFKGSADDAVAFLKRAREGKALSGELGNFSKGILKDTKFVKSNPGLFDDAIKNYTKELMGSKSSLATQFQGASRADRMMLLKNAGYPEATINRIVKQADDIAVGAVKKADDVVTTAAKGNKIPTGGVPKTLPPKTAGSVPAATSTPLKEVTKLKEVVKGEAAAMTAVEKAGYNIGKYGANVWSKIKGLKGKMSVKQALLYGLAGYGAYELVKGMFGKDGKNADGVLPSCVANLPDVEFVIGQGDVVVARIPDGVDEKSKNRGGLEFWPNGRAISVDREVRGNYYCKGTSGGSEEISATIAEQATDETYSNIHIDWDGEKASGGGGGKIDDAGPARTRSTYKPCANFDLTPGCKSDYVREVQLCLGLPQKYQTGNFGPITTKALSDAGYDGSKLTKDVYLKITSNCNGSTTGTTTEPTKRLDAEPIKLPTRDIKLPSAIDMKLPQIAPIIQSNQQPVDLYTALKDAGYLKGDANETRLEDGTVLPATNRVKYKGPDLDAETVSKLDTTLSGLGYDRIKQKIDKSYGDKYVWLKR